MHTQAVYVESKPLAGDVNGCFGCEGSVQSAPSNPGEGAAVLFGPAIGYVSGFDDRDKRLFFSS
jgi:hypothetical protein